MGHVLGVRPQRTPGELPHLTEDGWYTIHPRYFHTPGGDYRLTPGKTHAKLPIKPLLISATGVRLLEEALMRHWHGSRVLALTLLLLVSLVPLVAQQPPPDTKPAAPPPTAVPPADPVVALVKAAQASLQARQYTQAAQQAQQALDQQIKRSGADAPALIPILVTLGDAQLAQRQFPAATASLTRARTLQEKTTKATDPSLLPILSRQVECATAQRPNQINPSNPTNHGSGDANIRLTFCHFRAILPPVP